jgi:2-deoxy-D-gluconate 3-dehydrogenase
MSVTEAHSPTNLFSLPGKTVIVTGATGSIGLTLAVALAEAGADIVSIQMPNDPGAKLLREKIECTGRKLHEFDSNLKDYKTISVAFEHIWAANIVPDILLNCAGITRHALVEDTPIAYLEDVS